MVLRLDDFEGDTDAEKMAAAVAVQRGLDHYEPIVIDRPIRLSQWPLTEGTALAGSTPGVALSFTDLLDIRDGLDG